MILLAILALRVLTAEHPVAGANLSIVVASGSLAGFAAWVMLSQLWSDSASRSLLEFDRVLVYLLALLSTGLLLRTRPRVQALVWAVAIAIVVVAGAGLLALILRRYSHQPRRGRRGWARAILLLIGTVSGCSRASACSSCSRSPAIAASLG